MTDANLWVAIAAGVTVVFQLLGAAYFYGSLSQRVRNMADAASEHREFVRKTLDDLRVELRDLRNRLWRNGNLN